MTQTNFSEFLEVLETSQGETKRVRNAPERVNRVVDSIVEPGRSVVLTGEPGNGKARLAEEAAYLLADRLGKEVEVFVLPPPGKSHSSGIFVFASAFPQSFTEGFEQETLADPSISRAEIFARRLQRHIAEISADKEVVMVAPRIDRYSGFSEQLLHRLVRWNGLRVIATAQRLSGAADRIMRDPHVSVLSVGPLSIDEAQTYLAQLLRVERVDRCMLIRWHRLTGGNAYALTMLALAADRVGSLERSRGAAWEKPGNTVVPGELQDFFLTIHNETEIRTLELVAVAEPIHEVSLLTKLDTQVVTQLCNSGLLSVRTLPSGSTALELAHPLFTQAVLANLSPMRRLELNDEVYHALLSEQFRGSYLRMPHKLMRLVTFGIASGHTVSLEWLLTAYEVLVRNGNPFSVIETALAIAHHPEVGPEDKCEVLIKGRRFARLVGDVENTHHIHTLMRAALKNDSNSLSATQRVTLRVNLAEAELWEGQPEEVVINLFDEIEKDETANQPVLKEFVRSSQTLALGIMGQLNTALECAKEYLQTADYVVNTVRAPALLTAAFVLQQRGEVQRSIAMSENVRRFALLGNLPRTDLADVQGFCMLLGYWASGNMAAGVQLIEEFSHQSPGSLHTNSHYSGLIDCARVLQALQDARWAEASHIAEALLERLAQHDSYGIAGFVQAALALALAAQTDLAGARSALRAAAAPQRGLTQGLGGYARLLRLRAKTWLHSADVLAEAQQVANWAQSEDLAFIELQALHVIVCNTANASPETVDRVQALVSQIDTSVAETIRSHVARISAHPGAGSVHEMPEAQELAEHGIWLPLPPSPGLTAREREVAFLASHGHSNRFIAEKLRISPRTVETHLSHVFSKLNVDGREGLRRWFVTDRHETNLQQL